MLLSMKCGDKVVYCRCLGLSVNLRVPHKPRCVDENKTVKKFTKVVFGVLYKPTKKKHLSLFSSMALRYHKLTLDWHLTLDLPGTYIVYIIQYKN